MFFDLINIFANFMNYIHEALIKYLNLFVIIYCGGARPLDGKIKKKNFSCKIDSIHHSSKINQASV